LTPLFPVGPPPGAGVPRRSGRPIARRKPDTFRPKYNPGVFLSDETGALPGHLYASAELSGLGLFDPDGKPRVAVTHRNGWPGVFLKDRGGANRAGMSLDAIEGPRFIIQDEAERPLVSLP
jgi:hypothetical protein